jgi:hypothetical protein
MRDIEDKVTRVGASKPGGERVSMKKVSGYRKQSGTTNQEATKPGKKLGNQQTS